MRSFLFRLYGFSLADELMLIYPFYAVMFVDYGLSGLEVSLLFAAWSGTCIVLEVPSGALADRFSRKRVMFAGELIRVTGYACWALYPDFWGFLIGFVLWGTEGALSSGAFEALVYDELKRLGRESEYVKVLGRTRSFRYAGMIAASVAAAAAVGSGYEFLLWGSVAAVVLAGFLVLSLPEAPAAEATREGSYFELLGNGVSYVVREPAVLRLIVFISFALTIGGVLDEYWTLFATEAGLPKYSLGLFLAVLYAVPAVASFVAHKFEALPARMFCGAVCACGGLLLAAAWQMQPASIALLVVFTFLIEMTGVVFDGRLQHIIPSETRATVSSVRGFSIEVCGILAFLGMGSAVGEGEYRIGFLAFGALLLVVGLIYTVWMAPLLIPRGRQGDVTQRH